jgi:sugar/nucleoside kinase (ribokinase family)
MDVIGIGALNIDYIKSMPWTLPLSHHVRALRQEFEPGKEVWITHENIRKRIHKIGIASFDYIGPGGSAFNTIRCLAQLNLDLKLGYVSVVGAPSDGCNLKEHIAKHSIDSSYIFDSDSPSGNCVSLYWPSEQSRGIKTASGANDELEAKLSDPETQVKLTKYIAMAKWVHLTSFVNQGCLSQVILLLKNAKLENPSLIISFDPGSEYCSNPTPQVKEAIKISDYLFVNWREFCQLAGHEETQDQKRGRSIEKDIASDIFNRFQCSGLMIVVKTYNSTRLFQIFGDSALSRHYGQSPLLPSSIKDDTGAGDVFTAGFIGARLTPALKFDLRTTMELCTRLAKTKLRMIGCDAGTVYEEILEQVIEEIDLKENMNL